tara:strand:+ start:299 stop:445 length:147 start_codon:yes stop_codon:yes gene_type:complete
VAWILEILPSIQKDKTKIHIPYSREGLKEKISSALKANHRICLEESEK